MKRDRPNMFLPIQYAVRLMAQLGGSDIDSAQTRSYFWPTSGRSGAQTSHRKWKHNRASGLK